jgi:uncharacterized protein
MNKIYLFLREVKHQIFTSVFGFSSTCQHSPSCSEYTKNAVKKHGIIKGGVKSFKRIMSCVAY